MTLKELNRLNFLKREHEFNERWIDSLQSQYERSHSSLIQVKITALLEVIKANDVEQLNEQTKIINFIQNVDDPYIRLIIKLKYVECRTWNNVTMLISPGASEDMPRKTLRRYLSNLRKK